MQTTTLGNRAEFLLDNEYFYKLHELLTRVERCRADANTFVSIGMWSADLDTQLPHLEDQAERSLQDALMALNEAGHKVCVILWYGSTVRGVTGYKEHEKALRIQAWARDKAHVEVYLEPYKSALGVGPCSYAGGLLGAAVGWTTGYDVSRSTNAGYGFGMLVGSTGWGASLGWGASMHQKIVVVSVRGELHALIGGFNLGSEYSCEANHAIANQYWHDTALELKGPAAAIVHNEWVRRWNKQGSAAATIAKVNPSAQPQNGTLPITIATTNSESPTRENDIRELMVDQIRRARASIYIENYAFTDPALVSALEARLSRRPRPRVVVLINHPKSELFEANTTWSYFQADVHETLARANGGESVMYGARTSHTRTSRGGVTYKCWPYPHSKLAIFDDTTLVLGSANWTYRSMEYDGEISAFITDRTFVSAVRQRLLSHWWKTPDGNGPTEIDLARWISDAGRNNHNAPGAGCKIVRLRTVDFTDWETLSYQKRAMLRAAWTMF